MVTTEGLTWAPTLPSHSHLQAFLQTAVLALVSVVLVNGTVPIATALVCQIPSDTAFEEGLTSFTSKLSVMFSTGFISANHTFNLLLSPAVFFRTGRRDSLGRPAGQVSAVPPRRYGQCRHATLYFNDTMMQQLLFTVQKHASRKCCDFTQGVLSLRAANHLA